MLYRSQFIEQAARWILYTQYKDYRPRRGKLSVTYRGRPCPYNDGIKYDSSGDVFMHSRHTVDGLYAKCTTFIPVTQPLCSHAVGVVWTGPNLQYSLLNIASYSTSVFIVNGFLLVQIMCIVRIRMWERCSVLVTDCIMLLIEASEAIIYGTSIQFNKIQP